MGRPRASTVVVASFVLAACGGSDATSPGQNGSLGITLSASSVSVPQGGTGTATVTITRGGGFSGAVTLAMEGAPTGVTIGFSPHPLSGTTTGSTMTISVASTASVGRYLMTVHATASKVDENSAQIWLDITEPPDYSLGTAKDTVSVAQGATGQLDVTLTRLRGFAGDVTLTLEGVGAGITGTFSPNPVTADRSTLTLRADTAAATGKRTLTMRGAAAGLAGHTKTFVLDVLSAAVPGYTLTLSPTSLSVVPGGSSVSTTVAVHRTGGFTGAVSLGVQGHPTGVTWTSTPAPVTDSLATITLTAGLATQPGTYTLTVQGSASGVPARQATVQLTVQEAPGFTMTLSQSSITTAPGAAPQTVSVLISRAAGYTDTVRLSMTGLPQGVSAAFNPAATTAGATLTITATTGATAGTYTGTVHATATGLAERTAVLTITVSASSTDIVWRFCSPTPAPVFFALQDGVSPLVEVPRAGDGTYTTAVASGRAAVTIVVPGLPDTATADAAPGGIGARSHPARIASTTDVGYTTYMYYGSTSDLQQVAQAQCPGDLARKTIHGSVAGVPVGDAWTVALGGGSAIGLPGAGSAFTLSNVLAGPRDLVAARAAYSATQALADAFVIRRDLDPADGSILPVVDFAAGETFAPAAGTLTLSGVTSSARAETVLGYFTANGTSALLGQMDSVTNGSRAIAGVPASRLRTGDLHLATVLMETSNPAMELSATLYAAQVGAWSLAIASPPPLPTVDVYATSPVIRLRARGVLGGPGSAYGGMVRVAFVQATADRATVVYQSRGYIGTTQNFEIRTGGTNPLPGWNQALYGFVAGAPTTWSVDLTSFAYVFAPSDGGVLRTMTVRGQVTP